MEPISLIIGALAAGAAAKGMEVGGQALKDVYAGLKRLIMDRYAAAKPAVDLVESNPDSKAFQEAAAESLGSTDAGQDAELVDQAQALLDLLKESGQLDEARYNVMVSGSGAAAVGPGAVGAGEGGVAAGRDIHGGIHLGGGRPKPAGEEPDE